MLHTLQHATHIPLRHVATPQQATQVSLGHVATLQHRLLAPAYMRSTVQGITVEA